MSVSWARRMVPSLCQSLSMRILSVGTAEIKSINFWPYRALMTVLKEKYTFAGTEGWRYCFKVSMGRDAEWIHIRGGYFDGVEACRQRDWRVVKRRP